MKPVRGSARVPHKTPHQKNKRNTAKKQTTAKSPDETFSEQKHEEEELLRKAPHKRKAGGVSSSDLNKVKAKTNWKLMSRASITVVENIMDLSILATLSSKSKAKKEQQEHLSIIKNRFLDECRELKVPVQKQEALHDSHYHHQEEREKSVVGKKTLSTLEKDLSSVVGALEGMEEQMVSLQHQCSMLRNQVEEEEEKAKEILQITEQDVLNLPLRPSQKDETTLEERVRRMMSDRDRETTAKKLAGILQTSEITQNAQVLLKQAHKYADQLFAV